MLASILAVAILAAAPLAILVPLSPLADASPLVSVSYDANGGDSGGGAYLPPQTTFERGLGSSEIRFDPIPVREGYVFTGWNTRADGSGDQYSPTTPYEDRFYDGSSDAVMHAQWIPVGMSVDLSSESGSVRPIRTIAWNGDSFTYQVDSGEPVEIPGDVIRITGIAPSTNHKNNTLVSIDGANPFPEIEERPLYVMIDSLKIESTSVLWDTRNSISIGPGAAAVVQLFGDSEIRNNSIEKTIFRVVGTAIFTGQGSSTLTLLKNTAEDDVPAGMIGGNGLAPKNDGQAENGGRLQFESGFYKMTYINTIYAMRGTCIGGGGVDDRTNGIRESGSGGDIRIHGGTFDMFQQSTLAVYSTAIGSGGSGQNGNTGPGGQILITGGDITIFQDQTDNNYNYGPRGSGIGGAGAWDGKAGDSGQIDILGGDIKIRQGGVAGMFATGIGAGSVNNSSTRAAAGSAASPNYINIEGGKINIDQRCYNGSNPLPSAAIGGGAANNTAVKGGPADVTISGGEITINRTHLKPAGASYYKINGNGIGGGANERAASTVVMNGGVVNITMTVTIPDANSGSTVSIGSAMGCNVGINANTKTIINGGVLNISRGFGTNVITELANNPVGSTGDFGKAPIINGGSIRLTADSTFATSGANAPTDSDGHYLVKTVLQLEDSDDPQSLFVRKANVIDPEFGTPRYADFSVKEKHKNLRGEGDYGYLNLYLPQIDEGEHLISLEVASDGTVKTFSSTGSSGIVSAARTDASMTFYRVVYRIGASMRYEGDTVHIAAGAKFSQSIRAKNAHLDEFVAPWSVRYVERHDADMNTPGAPMSVTSLAGQYRYFASEAPLVLGGDLALTSYGNLEFNDGAGIAGRLVVTADAAQRVDVVYRDDATYESDPAARSERSLVRPMGEGYPAAAVGLAASGDPWSRDGGLVAEPLPEPSSPQWSSYLFYFTGWVLGSPDSGDSRAIGSQIEVSPDSGDVVLYSVWEHKAKIYRESSGPGHIEYSWDGGATWRTAYDSDDAGEFFPAPFGSASLRAVADEDGAFLWWSGDLSGQETPQPLQTGSVQQAMSSGTAVRSVRADFELIERIATLTAAKAGGGSGKVQFQQNGLWQDFPSSGTLSVPMDAEMPLRAAPGDGSAFLWWSGDLGGPSVQQTVSMGGADREVEARFELVSDIVMVRASTGGTGEGKITFQQNEMWQDFPSSRILMVPKGHSLPMEAVASDGSVFVWWTGDLGGFAPQQTLSVGDSNRNVAAEFYLEEDAVRVTATKTGAGEGKIQFYQNKAWQDFPSSGSLTLLAPKGYSLPVWAQAGADSVFLWWTGDLSGQEAERDLQIGDEDREIFAEFEPASSTVEVSAHTRGTGAGRVQFLQNEMWQDFPSSGKIRVVKNRTIQIGAAATSGVFIWWTGDLSGPEARQALVVGALDKSVTAEFDLTSDRATVTASVEGTGTGKIRFQQNGIWQDFPSSMVLSVPKGYSLPLEAAATSGVFVWWTGDLGGSEAQQALQVGSYNRSVTAEFYLAEDTVTVSASTAGNGSGKVQFNQNSSWHDFPESGSITVPKGFPLPMGAEAGQGSAFVWWTGDLGGVAPQQALQVGTSDKSVAAEFHLVEDTVIVSASVTGTGTGKIMFHQNHTWQDFPSSGSLRVPENRILQLEAVAETGLFVWWSGDLSGISPAESLAVGVSDKHVEAEFDLDAVSVEARVTGTGAGKVQFNHGSEWRDFPSSGTLAVPRNYTIQIGAVAETGVFVWWTGDLSGIAPRQSLQVGTSDKTVTAEFDLEADVVEVRGSTSGTGTGKIAFHQNGTWQDFPSSGVLAVPEDRPLQVEAKALAGVFVWWTGDLGGFAARQTLQVGTADMSIVAEFDLAADTVEVRGSTSGTGTGKIQFHQNGAWQDLLAAPLTVPKGPALQVRAAAETGVFVWWTGDLSGVEPQQGLSTDSDRSVEAEFYLADDAVSVSAAVAGSGSGKIMFQQNGAWQEFPSSMALTAPRGASLRLEAVAETGLFVWWSGDLSGPDAGQALYLDSDKSVAAEFDLAADTVEVRGSVTGSGSGEIRFFQNGAWQGFPSSGSLTVPDSYALWLSAVTGEDSLFLWWTGDLSGQSYMQLLHVGASDKSVTAEFALYEETIAVWAVPTGDGEGEVAYHQNGAWQGYPSSGVLTAPRGYSLRLMASPGDDSAFIWWSGDLGGPEPQQTLLTGSEDMTVYARFEPSQDTVRVTASKSGTGTGEVRFNQNGAWQAFPSDGRLTVPKNEALEMGAAPGQGSAFVWWTGDLSGPASAQTLHVGAENKHVTAEFHLVENVVTVSAHYAGTGSGEILFYQNSTWQGFPSSGALAVAAGSDLDLMAQASAGSVFVWWTQSLSGQAARQTLSVGAEDRDVTAEFHLIENVVTVSASYAGTGSGKAQFLQNGAWQDFPSERALTVAEDSSLELRAQASAGSVFAWWSQGLSGPTSRQTLQIGGEDVGVTAEFDLSQDIARVSAHYAGAGSGKITFLQNGAWQDFPSGEMAVPKGFALQMDATASQGSVFVWWSQDLSGPVSQQTLQVGTSDKSVTAEFATEAGASSLIGSVAGTGTGKIQFNQNQKWQDFPESGSLTVPAGSSLELRARADPGSTFVWWSQDLSGPADRQALAMDAAEKRVTAEFYLKDDTSTVAVTMAGNGFGSAMFLQNSVWQEFPESIALTVPRGSPLEVDAIADADSTFLSWSGGGLSATPSHQALSIGDPHIDVTATFTSDAVYTLYLTASEGGSVEYRDGASWAAFPAGGLLVQSGAQVDARAVASGEDRVFSLWTGDLTFLEPEISVHVSNHDVTAQAQFLAKASASKLTASTEGTGSGAVQLRNGSDWRDMPAEGVWLADGYVASVRAHAASGAFVWWTGALSGPSAEETVPIGPDKGVTARFDLAGEIATIRALAIGTGEGKIRFNQNGAWQDFPASRELAVPKSASIELEAAPAQGSVFVWWTQDLSGPEAWQVLSMGGSDRSVTAEFDLEADVVSVKAEAAGDGEGRVQFNQNGVWQDFPASGVLKMTVPKSYTLPVRAQAESGSAFLWWAGDLSGPAAAQGLNVGTEDKSVTAEFAIESDTVGVEAEVIGNGTGEIRFHQNGAWQGFPASGRLTVPKGYALPLLAAPAQGSEFLWWTEALSGQTARQDLDVGTEDKSVTAEFELSSNVVKVTASTAGTGSGKVQFNQNGVWQDFPESGVLTVLVVPKSYSLPMRAQAESGSVFVWWTGDLSGQEARQDLSVGTAGKSVAAEFYLEGDVVVVGAGTSGTGSGKVQFRQNNSWQDFPESGVLTVPKDTSLPMRARAAQGSVFVWWTGDLSGQTVQQALSVGGSDKSVVADFYLEGDVVDVEGEAMGTGSGRITFYQNKAWQDFPSSGRLTVPKGCSLQLGAEADSGSVFVWWTGDLSGQEAPQTLHVGDEGKAVAAEFDLSRDVASVAASTSGTGSGKVQFQQNGAWQDFPASGVIKVSKNTSLPLTASATSGVFVWWTGDLSGPAPMQALSVGVSDRSVAAEFDLAADTAEVVAEAIGNGSGRVRFQQNGAWQDFPASKALTVPIGYQLPLGAAAEIGSVFVWWEGDLSGPAAPQTLQAGPGDKAVKALFQRSADAFKVTAHASGSGSGKVQFQQNGAWQDFPASGVLTVPRDADLEMGAAAAPGSVFIWWSQDMSGPAARQTLSVGSSDKNVTAQFEPEGGVATVTALTTGAGAGKVQFRQNSIWQDFPASKTLTVPENTTLQLRAQAGQDSVFLWWTQDLSGQTAQQALAVGVSDRSVTAEFAAEAATATVYAEVIGNGAGKIQFHQNGEWRDFPQSMALRVAKNSSLDLMAAKGQDSVFLWWTRALSGQDAQQTLSVGASDESVTAEFELASGTASVSASTSGTGTGKVQFHQNGEWRDFPASGSISVSKNSSIQLGASAISGSFVWWEGDMTGQSAQQALQVGTADRSVAAVFSTGTATVSAHVVGSGSGRVQFHQNGAWQDFPSPGPLTVPENEPLSVRARASPGSVFVWWTQDLSGQTAQQTLQVGSGSMSVTAEFIPEGRAATVTAQTAGTGSGKVTFQQNGAWQDFPSPGKLTVEVGSTLDLEAAPGSGSVFLWWSGDLSGPDAAQALAVSGEASVTAEFAPEGGVVSVSASTSGTGSGKVQFRQNEAWQDFPASKELTVPENYSLQLRARADAGSAFVWWTGDLSGQTALQTLSVGTEDRSVTAEFAPEGGVVSVSASTSGTGSGKVQFYQNKTWQDFPASKALTVPENSSLEVRAQANSGSEFVWWARDLSGPGSQRTLAIGTEDREVEAEFYLSRDVTTVEASVTGTGFGKVRYSQNGTWQDFPSGKLTVPRSYQLPVRAEASAGEFLWWTGDLSGQEASQTLSTGTTAKEIVAEFALSDRKAAVEAHAIGDGTGKVQFRQNGTWQDFPASGSIYVAKDSSIELRARADAGSAFVWWTGDLSGQTAQQTLSVGTEDRSVTAEFEPLSRVAAVTAKTAGNGTGRIEFYQNGTWQGFPSGALMVPKGSALSLDAIADGDSNFLSWSGGGMSATPQRQGLSVGDSPVTVTATFTSDAVYTLYLTASEGGSVEYRDGSSWLAFPSLGLPVLSGSQTRVRAVASDSDHAFSLWTGGLTQLEADIAFDMPHHDVTAQAQFLTKSSSHTLSSSTEGVGDGSVQLRSGSDWRDIPSAGVRLADGYAASVRALPEGGSVFIWWTQDLSGPSAEETVAIDSDKRIAARFDPESKVARVTASTEGDGSGKAQYLQNGDWRDFPSPGALTVPAGSDLEVRALADEGSVFVWWTQSLSGYASLQTLSVGTGDIGITAEFAPAGGVAKVTASKTGLGSGEAQFYQNGAWQEFPQGALTVPANSQLRVRAAADEGSAFLWWTGALSGYASQQTLSVGTGDIGITAEFALRSDVAAVAASTAGTGSGKVQFHQNGIWQDFPSDGVLTVLRNSVIRLGASATSGEFLWWTGDLSGQEARQDLSVGATGKSVTAEFVMPQGSVIVEASAIGSGSGSVQYHQNGTWQDFPSDGRLTVPKSAQLQVRAHADPGSAFVWWTGDLSGQAVQQTLSVGTEDKAVTAEFAPSQDVTTVSASKAGNGSGSVLYHQNGSWREFPSPGALTAIKGSQLQVRAAADGDSSFLSWSGGGLSATPEEQALSVGGSPVAITATFTSDAVYTLRLTASEGGSVEYRDGSSWLAFPSLGLKVPAGAQAHVRAVESGGGYAFSLWTGGLTQLEADIAFDMPHHDVTAQAQFLPKSSSHRLTAAAEGTGAGSVQLRSGSDWRDIPSAGVWLADGYVAGVRASAAAGSFIWWTGDLSGISAEETVAIGPDKRIAARFDLASNLVKVRASVIGGGSGDVRFQQNGEWHGFPSEMEISVPKNQSVRLGAFAEDGSMFLWWTGALGGQAPQQDLAVGSSDKEVVAEFSPAAGVAKIAANAEGTGSGKVQYRQNGAWHDFPTQGALYAAMGSSVRVKAIASSGSFVWWTGDLGGAEAEQDLQASAMEMEICAWFYMPADIVTVSASVAGAGAGKVQFLQSESWYDFPSSGKISVPRGGSVQVRAVASSGEFSHWSGDAPGYSDQTVSLDDVQKSYSLTAHFAGAGRVSLTVRIAEGAGAVYATVGGARIALADGAPLVLDRGAQVSLSPVPEAGKFSHWSGDQPGMGDPMAVSMDSDKSIGAHFTDAARYFSLEVRVTGSGSVMATIGQATFECRGVVWLSEGGEVSLEAVAAYEAHPFAGWTGDREGEHSTLEISMDGNLSVTAVFSGPEPGPEPEAYTVHASSDSHASVSPKAGSTSVPKGGSITYSFVAHDGWIIAEAIVDGVSSEVRAPTYSHTFAGVSSNHTISVSCSRDPGEGPTDPGDGDGDGEGGYGGGDGDGSGGDGEGGGSGEGGAPSALIAAAAAAALAFALLLIYAVAFRGRVDVAVDAGSEGAVSGKGKARRRRAYRFSVEGGGSPAYRVGGGAWREPAPLGGGVYEIPARDVTDRLTIMVR
ncbi:MAG: InlB B-repeat-containing protein [Candidatus Methanoplasma sp.]|jgi:uncharacterized protein YaiE (UPF0345 family)|nr:InlB B-repeat-containing protein [Candidatus Methanoplasma sp.]